MYYDFTPGPRPNALEHYAWQMKLEPSSFHHITWWTTLASCCCQLQPTKSRKCSSSPCGWWEFFVTNGQKVLNFSFDFMHLLYQRQNLWMRLKRRDFSWPRSVYSPNNLMDLQKLSGTIGEKYTSICMELHDMQRMFLRA